MGKKTAERLLVEMRDKLSTSSALSKTVFTTSVSEEQDAISALIALGYKPQEAMKRVQQVAQKGNTTSSETLIRLALQGSAKS